MKDVFPASGNQKKASTAIFRSVKVDFKPKMVNQKKNYIMIKKSIHQEDKTITNTYAPNN